MKKEKKNNFKLANSILGGGGIQNKNAFTLIELLAIIVILAIIAVITVPIILNVIENSRVGAAKDSAYGYKDAINKYYVSELYENLDFKLDGTYTITDKGRLSNGTGVYEIPFTGTQPTGGNLIYENNILTSGCIEMDEYKVNIENGEITTVEKGSCGSLSLTACNSSSFNPSPESWFNFDSTTGTITGFSDSWDGTTDITIPCQINGVDVVNIGAGSLYGKNLTSLIIGDSVTTILGGSFFNNQLKTVILGDNVKTIEGGTFNNNQLISLYLGKNLETIGSGAFANNQLKEIIIPDKVTNIGSQAFFENNMEKLKLGKSVETIGREAFSINALTEVTIPESVTTIDYGAFSRNMLTTVTIYGKDIQIAEGSFKKLKNDNYSSNGKTYDYKNANLTTIYNNTGKSLDWGLIINGISGYDFETGTVINPDGNVEVVKSN